MNHHHLKCYSGFCNSTNSFQEIQLNLIEIPILGKQQPEYKAYPLICSNEECPKNGTVNCDLYQDFIKH